MIPITIKNNEDGTRYCDYCRRYREKYVHNNDDYQDICFDCVLAIYELARKEVLN